LPVSLRYVSICVAPTKGGNEWALAVTKPVVGGQAGPSMHGLLDSFQLGWRVDVVAQTAVEVAMASATQHWQVGTNRQSGMESAAADPSLFKATDATTTPRMTVSSGMSPGMRI
jgi:hypothetical protein